MKEEKLTFWKKIKFSIFDFDKYQNLAAEKISKTILYIAILILIFAIVIAGVYTYKFLGIVNNVKNYVSNDIETITFGENLLTVVPKNGEEIAKIEDETSGITIIINTQADNETKVNESIKELTSGGNKVLILKDKILIKSDIMTSPYSSEYKNIAEKYNINKLDKQEILNLLSINTIKPLIVTFFIITFIYMFIIQLSSTLVDIIVLSIFGYIVSLITKIRLKYTAIYNIAAYALTLSIILNIIYFAVNSFCGFTIQYFEIMYTTLATIYITAAILLIRSDVIKKQIELNKIIEEQVKVRQELEKQEEERKEKEEKDKQKREEEKNRKKKEKEDENGNLGEEPEGNNV